MTPPFDTKTAFLGLIALVVLERLVELVITRRNARHLEARGGFEVGRGHFGVMALLHTTFLIAGPLEVWLLDRPFLPVVSFVALGLLTLTMALRYWAILSLGDRWTARVFVVPGEPPVVRGPYRYLRHPNYLAVIVEIAALPMVHGAWITALTFSLANAVMLRTRIGVEENALADHSDYRQTMGPRARFLPGSPGE